MRRLLLAVLICACLVAPTHAAWVWVYGGEKHVVVPPEEGQPEWASYPDADGDGKPDPIITKIEFRLENDEGEALSKARVGQAVHLVAVPELGGLELETLTVRFHLTGPQGKVEVVPEAAIGQPTPLGMAPAIYRGQYAIPDEPVEDWIGEYDAGVEVELGAARSAPEMATMAQFRVVGPKETTPQRVARELRTGLLKVGEEVSRLGQRVARDAEAWLERTKQGPPPGALRIVHERATRGMVEALLAAPDSALAADRDSLSIDRGAALRSRTVPARSVIIIPLGSAKEAEPDGSSPIGYLAMTGLRAPGATGVAQASPTGEPVVYRLVLEAGAEDEVNVGLRSADATSVASVPARVKWLNSMPWPRESYLKVERHPDAETDGLVSAQLVAAVTGGAARIAFTLPVVPAPSEETGELERTGAGN